MNKLVTASAALVLAMAGTAAVAQQAMTENDVRAQLEHDGYQHVHDLKFTDGMWRAKAEGGDGTNVTVKVDPKTGKAFPDKQVARLSKDDVKASLSSQGYTDVHDVDMDDGVWHAEAKNPAGEKVEVQVDPNSGKVIGSDDD
jgi:uncharacterized membrane protein YkoI